MPPGKPKSGLSQREVNPVPFIVAGVVLVVVLIFFFVIKPGMDQRKIEGEWSDPKNAALRGPGRPKDPAADALAAQLRAKELGNKPAGRGRRRDDNE